MTGLSLQNVEISLQGKLLLDINAVVEPGGTLTVMGPSGVGKSSLLAYIGGFLDLAFSAKGKVILNQKDISVLPAQTRGTGILFQDPLLFPHMSVGENLLFAVPQNVKGLERSQRVEEALTRVGLEGYSTRDPATLSGGQKARVALMRVLLSQPSVLLLDEPFSKLDADRRSQIRELVFAEAKQQNLPTILVTHDEDDAMAAGDQLIRLTQS